MICRLQQIRQNKEIKHVTLDKTLVVALCWEASDHLAAKCSTMFTREKLTLFEIQCYTCNIQFRAFFFFWAENRFFFYLERGMWINELKLHTIKNKTMSLKTLKLTERNCWVLVCQQDKTKNAQQTPTKLIKGTAPGFFSHLLTTLQDGAFLLDSQE